MKYCMNQGLVCPFEPKLCQDVAMGSRNPLEPLWTPKTSKKLTNPKISDFRPPLSPLGPISQLVPISDICDDHIRGR